MLEVKSAQNRDKYEPVLSSSEMIWSIGGVWDSAACPQLKQAPL